MKNFVTAILIFLVSALFFSYFLHGNDLYTRGEAREAIVVKAMLEQGNYILPVNDIGEIAFKPPAYHWLGVAFAKIFGEENEIVYRLPSVLTGSLTLSLFFLFVASTSSYRVAMLTTLILASSLEFLRSSSHARVDMCLAFSCTVALVSLYHVVTTWSQGGVLSWKWLLVATMASAMAILSKGPMGVLIPITVSGVYAFALAKTPRLKNILSFPYLPALCSIMVAVGLSGIWYYLAYSQQSDEFLRVHLMNENLARFTDVADFDPGHRKPFFYSIVYYFVTFFPWSLLSFIPVVWFWRSGRTVLVRRDHGVLFALIWALVVVAMVTVSASKRTVYLLPGLPAFAYLLAVSLVETFDGKFNGSFSRQVSFWLFALFATVVTAAGILVYGVVTNDAIYSALLQNIKIKPWQLPHLELFRKLLASSSAFYVAYFLGALSLWFSVASFRKGRISRAVSAATASVALLCLSFAIDVLPAYSTTASPKESMKEIEMRVPDGEPIYHYAPGVFYAAIFYSHRRIVRLHKIEEIRENSPGYYLIRAVDLPKIEAVVPVVEKVVESDSFGANSEGSFLLVKTASNVIEQGQRIPDQNP